MRISKNLIVHIKLFMCLIVTRKCKTFLSKQFASIVYIVDSKWPPFRINLVFFFTGLDFFTQLHKTRHLERAGSYELAHRIVIFRNN